MTFLLDCTGICPARRQERNTEQIMRDNPRHSTTHAPCCGSTMHGHSSSENMSPMPSSLLSLKTQSRVFILFAILLAFQTIFLTSKLAIPSADAGPSSLVVPNNKQAGVIGPNTGRSSLSSSSQLDPHDTGQILPDGTITFTPDEFQAGRHENYVNLPNVPADTQIDATIQSLMEQTVPLPAERLLHDARDATPGHNTIVGLASYPTFMNGWRKLVGSLRVNGYDGHIILGVNPDIPEIERDYLDSMGVTYYAVHLANCTPSILDGVVSNTKNAVRAKCSQGLENLKLEWGRYEMARRWIHHCNSCTGWNMVIDTRDIFFQSDPFASLGGPTTSRRGGVEAEHDSLLFVEEIAQYTNTLPRTPRRATNLGESERYKMHVNPCYGKDSVKAYELLQRPMLCSGTVIGTRSGIHRFLSVLVHEFHTNNEKSGAQCKSPSTTDQWTMNYLYYKGQFGYRTQTKTLPWGTGPVLTVGKPCVNSQINSQTPGMGASQKDMMVFDKETGLILNPHETNDKASLTRVAPTLHQVDRCSKWMNTWYREHERLFMKSENPEDEPAMEWVTK